MNAAQLAQLRAQLKVVVQMSTCGSTSSVDVDRASGIEPVGQPKQMTIPSGLHTMSLWRECPSAPHHRYIDCSIGNFGNHEIPSALLAQERDNYITQKMQTYLRSRRAAAKGKQMSHDEQEKFDYIQNALLMNSRQRYVRDMFYRSYCAFDTGKPLKQKELVATVRLKRLSQQEVRKGFVIRGNSYNKYLWPTGEDIAPETPFTPLPRHMIRNRQKNNVDMDLSQTLPVVASVLSTSASLIVVTHAFSFFSSMRRKYAGTRTIRQQLEKRNVDKNTQEMEERLRRMSCGMDFEWDGPVFTHGIRLMNQPLCLRNCELHKHQIEGLSWMVHLYEHHGNALLADEVGLGKTLQVIAFLAWMREQKHTSGPHLVAMPGSVLTVWKDEFSKWMPSANVVLYFGKKKRRHAMFEDIIVRGDCDIVLTPYSILGIDEELLSTIPWKVMVFDECSRLKNARTSLFHSVDRMFFPDFRILATATPFQNEVEELWSLLYLVSPKMFCSAEVFSSFFRSLDTEKDQHTRSVVVERLQQVLRPFMLRRGKKDIMFDIPRKLEITIKLSPSHLQEEIVALSADVADKAAKLVLSRKVSNSPTLFVRRNIQPTIPAAYILSRSPKMRMLDTIVRKLAITGHKFLIYSQWTSMLDIISAHMSWRGLKVGRIDGSLRTSTRMQLIHEFTAPESDYVGMLLSTRSSAYGLNLQVADTVILFDSDYNPFVELQASARVHRLGQTSIVVVIRLMMVGTGEEKVLSVSRRKFLLGSEIIEGGRFNFQFAQSDGNLPREFDVQTPEITDPSESQIDSVIARSTEDQTVMQMVVDTPLDDDTCEFSDYDTTVMTSFMNPTTGVDQDPELEMESEWETYDPIVP